MEDVQSRDQESAPPTVAREPGTEQQKPRSCGGRCCLWGCGGLTVVCLAIIAGLVAAYFYVGAPWLERTQTELVERFPALGTVLERMPTQSGLQRLQEGSAGRENFPRDIYIPEDLVSGAFRTSETNAVARLRLLPTDIESLAASYRREMAKLGWERVRVPDPKEGIRLRFVRTGWEVRILVRRDPDAVSVWIHSHRVE